MPSRRRFVTACSAGISLITGCLGTISQPDIPRETQILNEQVTIEPGDYQEWPLSNRIDDSTFISKDENPIFSYEFVVSDGPAVVVAATTNDELKRRAETGGQYRMWGGTRSEGRRGATSEPMPTELLEVLVADNQYMGSKTPTPDRDPATVHVQAYLSTPKQG